VTFVTGLVIARAARYNERRGDLSGKREVFIKMLNRYFAFILLLTLPAGAAETHKVSGATAVSGVRLSAPSKAGSANAYLDSSVENFVEINYGYLSVPGETKTPEKTSAARPKKQPEREQYRDSFGPRVGRALPPSPAAAENYEEPQVPMPDLPSVVVPGISSSETRGAYRADSQTLRDINVSEANAPAGGVSGPALPAYKSARRGSLSSAVPPLGFKRTDCGSCEYEFAVLAIDPGFKGNAASALEEVRILASRFRFKPYIKDLGESGEVILVRGWLPVAEAAKLENTGFVRGLRVGKASSEFSRGSSAFNLPVVVSFKIPAGYEPRGFMTGALRELRARTGFAFNKTLDVRRLPVPDSGNGAAEYFVKVSGRLPLHMLNRAAQYGFVASIDAAPIELEDSRELAKL